MVGQDVQGRSWQFGCRRSVNPVRGLLRRPQPKMAQDSADHLGILDEGDYTHRTLALGVVCSILHHLAKMSSSSFEEFRLLIVTG